MPGARLVIEDFTCMRSQFFSGLLVLQQLTVTMAYLKVLLHELSSMLFGGSFDCPIFVLLLFLKSTHWDLFSKTLGHNYLIPAEGLQNKGRSDKVA